MGELSLRSKSDIIIKGESSSNYNISILSNQKLSENINLKGPCREKEEIGNIRKYFSKMPLERKNELKEGKQGFLHEEGNRKKIDERKKEILLRGERNQIEGGNLIG